MNDFCHSFFKTKKKKLHYLIFNGGSSLNINYVEKVPFSAFQADTKKFGIDVTKLNQISKQPNDGFSTA